ncbi:MAG: ribosome-associated translation inhibitor RaiA [Demequinaceae bacterium]|nr:ribosome-associated translation inhibitor RaiA [Demequinaceae bacterium]
MDVVVVGRHTKISDEFRAKVIDKLRRIETIDPRATRIDVHVAHERNPKIAGERERVELTVHGRRPIVRAEAASDDRFVALELAIDRVIERLRKRHERFSHRHQGAVGLGKGKAFETDGATDVEAWDGAPDTATREIRLDGTPIVIRSKIHTAAPMTISEALDRMEMMGHDFFLFHDSESDLPSVVYRRRGWTYGVLHLECEEELSASAGDNRLRETA